jgi:hypothetical protein
MPNREIFTRLAWRLYHSCISVDRITWLAAVREGGNGVRDYLKENVRNSPEEQLKKTFGTEQGAFLDALCDEGKIDEAVDEILRLGGWLVQASFRPAAPETVNFWCGRPYTWSREWEPHVLFIYDATLSMALCRVLLWGARLQRHAFAEAWRKRTPGQVWPPAWLDAYDTPGTLKPFTLCDLVKGERP